MKRLNGRGYPASRVPLWILGSGHYRGTGSNLVDVNWISTCHDTVIYHKTAYFTRVTMTRGRGLNVMNRFTHSCDVFFSSTLYTWVIQAKRVHSVPNEVNTALVSYQGFSRGLSNSCERSYRPSNFLPVTPIWCNTITPWSLPMGHIPWVISLPSSKYCVSSVQSAARQLVYFVCMVAYFHNTQNVRYTAVYQGFSVRILWNISFYAQRLQKRLTPRWIDMLKTSNSAYLHWQKHCAMLHI